MSGAEPWTASKMEASCAAVSTYICVTDPCGKTYAADVTGGGQSQTTNEAGTHVGQDITVQVGHDHHTVGVRLRVLHDLSERQSAARLDVKFGVPTCRQTRSRRSSSYVISGNSFATWRQADKNMPSDIFLQLTISRRHGMVQ